MNKASPNWGTLLAEAETEIPSSLLQWWLSDFEDCALTLLPLDKNPHPSEQLAFKEACERLRRGEPVQYVCGRAPFRDLTLDVSPAVLIPRPETEQLVQWVLDQAPANGIALLDVGTGSGCIALAFKSARPDMQVTGSEVSEAALEIARLNGEKNQLDVTFLRSDLVNELPDHSQDIVVANLPYIAEHERDALPEMVRDWEPGLALFSGESGLDAIEELLLEVPRILRPQGQVYLETGENHSNALDLFAKQHGWSIEHHSDLAGRERFHRLHQRTS